MSGTRHLSVSGSSPSATYRRPMPRHLAALVTAVLLAVLLAPSVATASTRAEADRRPLTPYSSLQLNLCLSGLAGCFDDTAYPAVVEEAIATIHAAQPDAVTVNEACSGDVARIAEETGMDFRFATVIYRGAPLPCVDPAGRGVFGNAVLTRATITSAQDQAFQAQLGSEERRWLCVRTADEVRVCTAHLSVAGSPEQAATNQAQCEELSAVLGSAGARTATVFGGDVNRQGSCAPAGSWTLRDDAAAQAPGIQHAYGTRSRLLRATAEIVPMTYTDHDGLLVRSLLLTPGRG